MWPFTKQKEEEEKVPDFKGVKFGKLHYVPAEDITPYEVALLLPLFIMVYAPVNREAYINNNNLQRHFKENIDE